MNTVIRAIIFIIVLAAVAFGIYYAYKPQLEKALSTPPPAAMAPAAPAAEPAPAPAEPPPAAEPAPAPAPTEPTPPATPAPAP